MGRFFVYRDNRYLSWWIKDWVTDIIVEFLTEEENFQEVDAIGARDWMTRLIKNEEVFNSAFVFAQDVIPNTLATAPSSDALVREYLEAGGKVVWIGDIPFYYQGLPNNRRTEPDWGPLAQNSILGIYVFQYVSSPLSVEITPDGREKGIHLSWAGYRPIIDPKQTLTTTLATSTSPQGYELVHGWFKNFNPAKPTSGFVRIWDYILHDASARMLAELCDIAKYGIE